MDYEEAISYIKSLRKDFEKDIVDTLPYTGVEYDNDLEAEALGMAIEALEKQIPTEPIAIIDCCSRKIHVCRVCKNPVGPIFDDKYCSECGQRIDWGDD